MSNKSNRIKSKIIKNKTISKDMASVKLKHLKKDYELSPDKIFKKMQKIVDALVVTEVGEFTLPENKHPLHVYTLADNKGLWWVAEYTNLKGVVGTARTFEEAVADLQVNLPFHLNGMKEAGFAIPEEYL